MCGIALLETISYLCLHSSVNLWKFLCWCWIFEFIWGVIVLFLYGSVFDGSLFSLLFVLKFHRIYIYCDLFFGFSLILVDDRFRI